MSTPRVQSCSPKTCEMGLEGIVSERLGGSSYWSGRVKNWVKVKNPAFQRR